MASSPKIRVLLVHTEAKYFAGAEKMLLYFLEEFRRGDIDLRLALIEGSKLASLVPSRFKVLLLPDNQRFSPRSFASQLRLVSKSLRLEPVALVHGWAARDWELSSILGIMGGVPAIGTLHDHPRASFITPRRQWLMRLLAKRRLKRIICVSDAVRQTCIDNQYPSKKLVVIRNGLPIPAPQARREARDLTTPFQIGFLGAFTERKGLRTFFATLDELAKRSQAPWSAAIAGGAQDEGGEKLVREIRENYSNAAWWPRVRWAGWVERPAEFLSALDLLVVPSSDFDPFPTVLLEAGFAGLPVVAADVGGVGEIVHSGKTGWLFEPNRADIAADLIENLVESPATAWDAGRCARHRVETQFSVEKMMEGYCRLYSECGTLLNP